MNVAGFLLHIDATSNGRYGSNFRKINGFKCHTIPVAKHFVSVHAPGKPCLCTPLPLFSIPRPCRAYVLYRHVFFIVLYKFIYFCKNFRE